MKQCASEEISAAASILTEGFMGKFSSLGLTHDVASGLMEATWENGRNHRYFVEMSEKEVIAAVHLKWNGPKTKKVSKKDLREKYGRRNTSKYLRGMQVLYEDVDGGDCYIAEFAVASEHRRKGIAGTLISSIKEYAVSEGFERLTLFVSDKNKNAIRLYEKLGFKTEYVKKSFFERLYFNEPRWRFMTFDLSR